ncbi:MAG TPA: FxsA family protein [Planctomycetota bacterium]|nr:FxsA family protein [Planctomycetota bacterium]
MRSLGCLGLLLFIALLCVEFYVLLVVMGWMKDVLGPLLIMAAMTVVGVKLAQFHAKRLPLALMSGQGGGRLIGLIGAVLIIVPGFITDILGLLLQLPLVQKLFSKVGMVLAASLVKRAMGGGFGKGFSGAFPGGGFPGAGFPGGFPDGPIPGMKPDERITNGKPSGPKTYDVQPDKD